MIHNTNDRWEMNTYTVELLYTTCSRANSILLKLYVHETEDSRYTKLKNTHASWLISEPSLAYIHCQSVALFWSLEEREDEFRVIVSGDRESEGHVVHLECLHGGFWGRERRDEDFFPRLVDPPACDVQCSDVTENLR